MCILSRWYQKDATTNISLTKSDLNFWRIWDLKVLHALKNWTVFFSLGRFKIGNNQCAIQIYDPDLLLTIEDWCQRVKNHKSSCCIWVGGCLFSQKGWHSSERYFSVVSCSRAESISTFVRSEFVLIWAHTYIWWIFMERVHCQVLHWYKE